MAEEPAIIIIIRVYLQLSKNHGFYIRWLRTHGGNQAFRFVEGIWLHRKSLQIRFFFSEKDFVFIIRGNVK